jgi:hypothetical protein
MFRVGEDILAELDQEGVEAFGIRAHTVQSGQKLLRSVFLAEPGLDHRLAAEAVTELPTRAKAAPRRGG